MPLITSRPFTILPGSCPGIWISNYDGTNNGSALSLSSAQQGATAALSGTKMISAGNGGFNTPWDAHIYTISDTTITHDQYSQLNASNGIYISRIEPVDDTLAFSIVHQSYDNLSKLYRLAVSGTTVTPTLEVTLNASNAGAQDQGIGVETTNTLVGVTYRDVLSSSKQLRTRLYNYTHDRTSLEVKPFGSVKFNGPYNGSEFIFMTPTKAIALASKDTTNYDKGIALLTVDPGDSGTDPSIVTEDTTNVAIPSTGNARVTGCRLTDTDGLIVYSYGANQAVYARRFNIDGDVLTVYDENQLITPTVTLDITAHRIRAVSETDAVLTHTSTGDAAVWASSVLCSSVNDVNTITAGTEALLSDLTTNAQYGFSVHVIDDNNRVAIANGTDTSKAKILKNTA